MSINPGLQIPYGVQPTNSLPVDAWSGPFTAGSFVAGISAANSAIPIAFRFKSMEVRLIVGGQSYKYWYAGGTGDSDLVPFLVSGMFGQYAYSGVSYNYEGTLTIPKYGSPNINANNAAGTATANKVYFNLIYISKPVTINKILSYCGTGNGLTSGGNVLYGIYSVSSIGYPDQKLYGSSSIDFTGPTSTQISVTGVATQLNVGWYFLAAIYSLEGAKVYTLSTQGFPAFGQNGAVMTSSSRAMYYYDDTQNLEYEFTLQNSYPTAHMYVDKGASTVIIPALYFEVV